MAVIGFPFTSTSSTRLRENVCCQGRPLDPRREGDPLRRTDLGGASEAGRGQEEREHEKHGWGGGLFIFRVALYPGGGRMWLIYQIAAQRLIFHCFMCSISGMLLQSDWLS